jgi:hypothetical protein
MNTLITLFFYLVCHGGVCHTEAFSVSKEALAIISCESGDGFNYGTYSLYARSKTNDGGLFQFNDKTYNWLMGQTNAETDSFDNQHKAFVRLWNDGSGWRHWKSSQRCWSQWLVVNSDDKAVWINQ